MTTATTIAQTRRSPAKQVRPRSNWARPHRSPDPAARPEGIFKELVDEWVRLCGLPHAGTFRKWARREPALAGTKALPDLLDRIDAGDSSETNEVLGALIRIAQRGDTLAGKVLLQAMLPKLARLSRSATIDAREGSTIEERRQLCITTFWEVMAGYPIERHQPPEQDRASSRPSAVASGLALDTLYRLTRITRQPVHEVPAPVLTDDISGEGEMARHHRAVIGQRRRRPGVSSTHYGRIWENPPDPTVEGLDAFDDPTADIAATTVESAPDPNGDLLSCVAWAVDVNAITLDQAAMLVHVYSPAPGQDGGHAAVAARYEITEAALRQRCSRATRAVAAAVRAHVEGDLRLAS